MKLPRSITLLGILSLAAPLASCVFAQREQQPRTTTPVLAPGYAIAALPSGSTVVTRGGVRYYVANGVYYRAASPRGFVVVPRPN